MFNGFLVNLDFQRISESVDVEIRRWATGKEGNMRALLSSLQIVSFKELNKSCN